MQIKKTTWNTSLELIEMRWEDNFPGLNLFLGHYNASFSYLDECYYLEYLAPCYYAEINVIKY